MNLHVQVAFGQYRLENNGEYLLCGVCIAVCDLFVLWMVIFQEGFESCWRCDGSYLMILLVLVSVKD